MGQKKQKTYSAKFKLETVLAALQGDKTKSQICRERQITNSMLYKWEQQFFDNAEQIFSRKQGNNEALLAKEAEIAELERMVGRLTMENDVLKKSASWLSSRSRSNER